MRHFFAPCPVTACPLRMSQAALPAALVAGCSLALRLAARGLRALRPAVRLATITTAAQQHLHAATRAHIQSGGFQPGSPDNAEERWTQKPPAGIVRTHRFPMRAGYGVEPHRQVEIAAVPTLQRRPLFTCSASGLSPPRHRPLLGPVAGRRSQIGTPSPCGENIRSQKVSSQPRMTPSSRH